MAARAAEMTMAAEMVTAAGMTSTETDFRYLQEDNFGHIWTRIPIKLS